MTSLEKIQDIVRSRWEKEGILDEEIAVSARTLTVEEAIGNPERDDFPLQQGKERLMEARFRNSAGQAFTDHFGNFNGPLREIAEMPLQNSFRRAIFVATLNAVERELGHTTHTIHCKDGGPAKCSPQLAEHIREHYGPETKITQIGYQPSMIEELAKSFSMRVIDLDPDNIGTAKLGPTIEGPDTTQDAIDWADLLLVTGSTIANDTVDKFITDTPVLFYGTTISAAADIMGWDRFCCQSS
ncbi:hypothetical protein LWC08_01200 [Desulfobaculum bizertense]|uniref:Rossmann-like domain-containing protein n=1 Tax=Desulfobaculum bizertense TaxID=376490 RepID=UPI001EED0CCB|nr:DUF364 domain-containing protein [Desulfobaculum bizertense]UIJ38203.1 hypothetical protein LWC08_01200 [Desulfobaculum bizertense]